MADWIGANLFTAASVFVAAAVWFAGTWLVRYVAGLGVLFTLRAATGG
ncbi:hypothetical protein [Brevundimonas sp. LjRoot202]